MRVVRFAAAADVAVAALGSGGDSAGDDVGDADVVMEAVDDDLVVFGSAVSARDMMSS